ncbi:IclR family transcriptional regulator [Muricoccus radiodurans]|uniref:IclR family transcriptional regulator n=1 Tax=Muricoccus radiodurans TaxID=2231721 RepID=UPI003CFA7310
MRLRLSPTILPGRRPVNAARCRGRPVLTASTEPRRRAAPASTAEDGLFVGSVEKAFRVLGVFGRGARSMGLTEIARAADMDRSAAQRFTHTLERLGYLRKDPRTKHYELTVRTLDLGHRYVASNALVDRAAPYMLDLSRATEEAVSLTIPDGTEIVYLSRLLSRHVLQTNIQVGSRLPAYCTAPGRAMLSRMGRDAAQALLERSDRIAYTPQTVTALPTLLARLDGAAEQGFALAVGEIYPGDVSVAAAVIGADGAPVAAVNVAVSLARCAPEAAVERFAPLVVAAAAAMSQSLPREAAR